MTTMSNWKDIPGYEGRYQINELGQVRMVTWGKKALLEPLVMKTQRAKDGYITVNLRGFNGKVHKYTVARLMAITFLNCPADYRAYNKNGDLSDNALENIGIRHKTKRRYRNIHRRPVCKVAKDGTVLEVYGSVSEAAKANYMSTSTVIKRCCNETKSVPEDFYLRYDSEVNYE